MSEKASPVADFYLDRNSGVYHFSFESEENWGRRSLENILADVAKYLHGQTWIKTQRAHMVVIGVDSHGDHYVLNNPEIWALEELADEFDGLYRPIAKRINNRRVKKVVVFNMVMHGREAKILEANVNPPETAHGYCDLYPEMMSLNTQELDAMMTELLDLHMLNMAHEPSIKWLRSKYRD